ncbi:hypothetical protein EJF18_40015 [Clavispora lusitaniae]|uniref:Transcription elongation factor Eaf N-terminal domain-containing protein n=2 Tax=Clavispora lusitaniae TaxID=36911 RepID=C4Y4X3_CLAL4|nr:uncharacterized protein CLUG_03207 [Clavispora lusitaniae ATCC 42720]QFZ27993.1 hypothetical protein EJF14_40015 [Clavispora lusitaniae]EEQ39079.1 hypothetical protein CLUG_03207 [Clavispora lusitaniae ATCC 42720]QFZ33657.1 hypothetical protein EJF16_40015 [Clavispora lusitaniae]QFZ39328.1 hypothetical protein EJF15_40015 [Clavispora lusitaniae]QFZ45010.1 hypothetical protein EJF18_40015 [Clavispora lusitaniae]
MNIPDGEYDIDLSVLGDEDDSSLALRYGFIPDSMDQTRAMSLFQTDRVCVVEAAVTERPGIKSLPIIFEGQPQRQRPASNGADSFYLTVSDGRAQLRRLSNTVRVNKSRNADKWRGTIAGWRASASQSLDFPDVSGVAAEEERGAKKARSEGRGTPKPVQGAAPPKGAGAPTGAGRRTGAETSSGSAAIRTAAANKTAGSAANVVNSSAANKTTNTGVAAKKGQGQAATRQGAAEAAAEALRNQPAKPESGSSKDMHSGRTSDTRENPSGRQQKQKDAEGERKNGGSTTSGSSLKRDSKKGDAQGLASGPRRSMPKPASKRPPTASNDIISVSDFEDLETSSPPKEHVAQGDMDDDFEDLENQLQEVLESESEQSDFAPIVVQVSEDEPKRAADIASRSAGRKPMSLRELYGGGRNDDMSSSEEE